MKRKKDSKVWLFSFSDLAFLLLIAFTQASTLEKNVKIGEINLPVVDKKTEISNIEPEKSEVLYQIRVNKPADRPDKPFQIVKIVSDKLVKGDFFSENELRKELNRLKKSGVSRPVLIPDKYSLSKDTVTGISILQQIWRTSERVVVKQS
ncbi:MAG: biopolymer transporter ExbD [Thermodesulfobacteriota bacterium]